MREKEVTGGRRKLRNKHRRNFPILGSHGEDYEHYCLANVTPSGLVDRCQTKQSHMTGHSSVYNCYSAPDIIRMSRSIWNKPEEHMTRMLPMIDACRDLFGEPER